MHQTLVQKRKIKGQHDKGQHFQRFLEVFRGFSKALSETLSETLSECHFPLRVAGRVAPNRVAP